VLTLVKGARIGGTYMSALYAAHRALAADLSTLAPGELGRVIFGGPKLDFPQWPSRTSPAPTRATSDLAGAD
jgi:hypothetical protein